MKKTEEKIVGICIHCGKPIYNLDEYLINDKNEMYHETCQEEYLWKKWHK